MKLPIEDLVRITEFCRERHAKDRLRDTFKYDVPQRIKADEYSMLTVLVSFDYSSGWVIDIPEGKE